MQLEQSNPGFALRAGKRFAVCLFREWGENVADTVAEGLSSIYRLEIIKTILTTPLPNVIHTTVTRIVPFCPFSKLQITIPVINVHSFGLQNWRHLKRESRAVELGQMLQLWLHSSLSDPERALQNIKFCRIPLVTCSAIVYHCWSIGSGRLFRSCDGAHNIADLAKWKISPSSRSKKERE